MTTIRSLLISKIRKIHHKENADIIGLKEKAVNNGPCMKGYIKMGIPLHS